MINMILKELHFFNCRPRSKAEEKPDFTSAKHCVVKDVSRNAKRLKDSDTAFWQNHLEGCLAVLLRQAGYSGEAQRDHWRFIAKVVAPNLGPSLSSPNRWESFMTDDGTPVELSWEWPINGGKPKIRYSIEPIGPGAGMRSDPYNTSVLRSFDQILLEALPETDMVWSNHFEKEFSPTEEHCLRTSTEGYSTHRFYAFDLENGKITAKVYFFPAFKAHEAGIPTLDVISQAILNVPQWNLAGSQALAMFRDFAARKSSANLEFDMLAIDLVEPSRSRVKIYYRSRKTDFQSVVDNLTLGGSARTPAARKGLESLQSLWDALFEVKSGLGTSLRQVDHRTAGILYYVELRPGTVIPTTKIYIPVRHYSTTDQHIVGAVSAYVRASGGDHSIQAYEDAMRYLFKQDAMQSSRGLHTYLGISIRSDGKLRIVSYLNPQISKLVK